ncbi:hypothetical protein [Leptospira interrogans]|uniref:hypothetical protein n=1 Tax=Leptospira interrogans TaxID=173 RepID=UPI0002B95216|nr:hypothetical protein [Leptospira interrogans]EMN94775.1 hypothetical protein LEP1GSC110_3373 [Leptospira interrogans serovar Medanensis str. UT053]EMO02046.1 hypothetical protein LEP1GSC112_0324 [Leptospira interrogans serovar Pomona str. UT364]QCO35631.1 hypothetical protein E4414_21725 [Leptospira interrogans]UMQ52629.1 hypothetical protein FH582_02040 [Leptospira interrogans]
MEKTVYIKASKALKDLERKKKEHPELFHSFRATGKGFYIFSGTPREFVEELKLRRGYYQNNSFSISNFLKAFLETFQ